MHSLVTDSGRRGRGRILHSMEALLNTSSWKLYSFPRTVHSSTGDVSVHPISFRSQTLQRNSHRNLSHRNLHRSSSDGEIILSQSEIPKENLSNTPRSQSLSPYLGSTDEIRVHEDDRSKIGDYYEEKLKSDPANSLLLTNYGRFCHKVEKDNDKAEEFYGRAILASPCDGEVLSLYGALIWETNGDEGRAKGYYERAIQASPNDCMIMGSYAHFLWEADEDGACQTSLSEKYSESESKTAVVY